MVQQTNASKPKKKPDIYDSTVIILIVLLLLNFKGFLGGLQLHFGLVCPPNDGFHEL